MKQTAESYFSETAQEFDAGYSTSGAFKERFNVWTGLWPEYFPKTGNVLDLGCGSGIFSFALTARGYIVTGVDGADNMIGLCLKRKDELHLANADFILSEIPFDKNIFHNPFDVVISSSVLEYIDEIDKVLVDVSDILKTNGIFMVSMPNRRSLYRFAERLSWKFTRRPKYMKYVRHVVNRDDFNKKITSMGFQLLHTRYYGRQGIISRIFPKELASTLFVSVFIKKDL